MNEARISELVSRARSIRRFAQAEPVPMETLEALVDLARQTASGGNLQPLKYVLCSDKGRGADIFGCLGWAAYLPKWPGPAEGERPAAYIVMLGDRSITENFGIDSGIASQTIMLGAAEQHLGGCIMASVNREKLAALLELPEDLDILLVLALGKPAEDVVMEPLDAEGSVKYWRDVAGVHHVPKRGLSEIIVSRYS